MKKGLTTTAVTFQRKTATVDDELDLLALVHRLPGVEQVWMNGESINIVHEPNLTTRDDVIGVIERRGYGISA